jgi:hypothetical protein
VLLSTTPARSSGYFANEMCVCYQDSEAVDSGLHDAFREAFAAYWREGYMHSTHKRQNTQVLALRGTCV